MRAFVSYCQDDESLKRQLMSALGPLIAVGGRLEVVAERRATQGDTWGPGIQTALDKADAALILVSRHYLASHLCMEVEVPRLRKAQRARNIQLIPVILDDCDWRAVPTLANLEPLPGVVGPLSTHVNLQEGLAEIRHALGALVGEPFVDPSAVTEEDAELSRRPRGYTRPHAIVKPMDFEPEAPATKARKPINRRVAAAIGVTCGFVALLVILLVRQIRAGEVDALAQQCDQADVSACARLVPRLEKACHGGDGRACARWGAMLLNRPGGVRDAAAARPILEAGCSYKSGESCDALGHLFEEDGDLERAHHYYMEAALCPDPKKGLLDLSRLNE